jgi:DNA repair exonuclease SbcCD nuclease subunit
MRIAIVSDFHLGYERFREDAYLQARDAFEKAYSMSDMMIMPGDIFDYRHPKPDVIAEAITLFSELSKKDFSAHMVSFEGKGSAYTEKPIVVIPGTHERRSDTAVDPVDLLGLAGIVVNVNRACAIIEKGSERVAVFGIGGVAEERFKETIEELAFRPVEGAFNIFMFHQSLYELLPFNKEFLHIEELPEGFDLYVDGHIHNKVESKCHGKPFLIPGSTVLTQLKEGEQEDKGFFIFDTEKMTYSFHPINSRKFVMLKIDVSGQDPSKAEEEINSRIKSTISSNGSAKPVIRIELKGRMKEGFKASDLNISKMPASYPEAIVEIARTNVDDASSAREIADLRQGLLENVPIKDYGMALFLDRLKASNYSMKISPSKLFEILSSDSKKDTAISKAVEELFS